MEILIPIFAVCLIFIFVGYVRRTQKQVVCPQCDGRKVRQIDQQLKELKQGEYVGYAIKLDVQLIMETTYRCLTCDHTWRTTAPEK